MKQKRKKCKNCKKYFKQTYSTLQVCCSTKCAIEYSKAKKEKQQNDLNKLRQETKQRDKITTLIKSVAIICHKYIRLRDKNKPCISCGTPYKPDFDAGHFYPAGKFSTLKFNENNIHGQCIKCNRFNEGNESEYRTNLHLRLSNEQINELDELARLEKQNTFKWSREKLIEIRNYYNEKIKTLN